MTDQPTHVELYSTQTGSDARTATQSASYCANCGPNRINALIHWMTHIGQEPASHTSLPTVIGLREMSNLALQRSASKC